MAADPYSAIRRLRLNRQAERQQLVERGESGSALPEYTTEPARFVVDDSLASQLGEFQSKYNAFEELPDGRVQITVQRPGMHKYDTQELVYRIDKATGDYVLDDSVAPVNSRQTSSNNSLRDGLEKGIGFVGTGLALAYGGAALAGLNGGAAAAGTAAAEGAAATGAATTAAGGTGATAATTAAGATNWTPILQTAGRSALANGALAAVRGGDGADILKAAAIGGLSAGAGSYASGALGLSPVASGAIAGGTGAALGGGDGSDIARGALVGGVSAYGRQALAPNTPAGSGMSITGGAFRADNSTNYLDPWAGTEAGTGGALTFDGLGLDITAPATSPSGGGFDLGKWFSGLFGGGGSGGSTPTSGGNPLTGNSQWLQTLLGLVGAGMQQVNVEKVAQDQRDWTDKRETEARRRRMPSTGALGAAVGSGLNARVIRGGQGALSGVASIPATPTRSSSI